MSATLASNGLPTSVSSQDDVDKIIGAVSDVVKGLELWQYYVLDVAKEKSSVKAALTSDKISPWTGTDVAGKSVVELAEILRESGKIEGFKQFASRFGVHVEPGIAAGFVKAAFTELTDTDALTDAWVRIVDVINVPLYQEWEEDTKVAVDNVKNRLVYTRLDELGPKLGQISKTCVVVLSLLVFSVLISAIGPLSSNPTSRAFCLNQTQTPLSTPSPIMAGSGQLTLSKISLCSLLKLTSAER